MGQLLALQCEVTTVRGITGRVDIVWSSNDIVLRKIIGTIATTMDNLLVYTDSYNISQLSTTDDGRVIHCEVVITASPPVMATNNITLNVMGMYVNCLTVLCDILFTLHAVPSFMVTTALEPPTSQPRVGMSEGIVCTVSTVSGVESSSVLIIWTGAGGGSGGGPIINDSRVSISPTTSSDNNYTSSVQFTYLMEGDEGTYACNVMILETSGSSSFTLVSLMGKHFCILSKCEIPQLEWFCD